MKFIPITAASAVALLALSGCSPQSQQRAAQIEDQLENYQELAELRGEDRAAAISALSVDELRELRGVLNHEGQYSSAHTAEAAAEVIDSFEAEHAFYDEVRDEQQRGIIGTGANETIPVVRAQLAGEVDGEPADLAETCAYLDDLVTEIAYGDGAEIVENPAHGAHVTLQLRYYDEDGQPGTVGPLSSWYSWESDEVDHPEACDGIV